MNQNKWSFWTGPRARVSHVVHRLSDKNLVTWCGVMQSRNVGVMTATSQKPSVCYRCRQAIQIGVPFVVVHDDPDPKCKMSGKRVTREQEQRGSPTLGRGHCPECEQVVGWEWAANYTNAFNWREHRAVPPTPGVGKIGKDPEKDVPAPF